MRLAISPAPTLTPVNWQEPPPPSAFRALSAAANLPEHVVKRQAARLKERLGPELEVEEIAVLSQDPGSLVFLWGPGAGFSALGARGKPAEKVADEAAEAYLRFCARQAALDRHLADQLLLYLAQAKGTSTFVTEEVTSHLLTNLWVIEQFLGPRFQVRGSRGERGAPPAIDVPIRFCSRSHDRNSIRALFDSRSSGYGELVCARTIPADAASMLTSLYPASTGS